MKATEIQRVATPAVEGVTALSAEIADKSRRLLGYYPSTVRVTGTLTQLLQRAQIEPLNRTQVNAYKSSKTRKSLTNHAKLWLGWFVATSLTITALIAGNPRTWMVITSLCLLVFAAFVIFVTTPPLATASQWKRYPIGDFAGYVPEFALSKAIALRELAPSVSIQVDSLITKRYELLPDPFLVVSMGKEEYYIDVWEEPDFERQTRG